MVNRPTSKPTVGHISSPVELGYSHPGVFDPSSLCPEAIVAKRFGIRATEQRDPD
jgi:hypothetical protein